MLGASAIHHKSGQLINPQPVWTHTASLIFVQYLIKCMKYSTLYYEIGFMLDDFAQL